MGVASCDRVRMLAVSLVLATGCGPDTSECERPLRLCDIGEASCQRHVFAQTACARGHEGETVPPVRAITRDELEAELRGEEPPDADEVRADAQVATFQRMLALIDPSQTSSDDSSIESYVRGVLAYYSSDTKSVTIIETNLADADREQSVFVLSHEFVHAQEDVDIDLGEFFAEYRDSADSDIATRALVEGEAVHYSNLTMARQHLAEVSHAQFNSYYQDQQSSLRANAADVTAANYQQLRSLFQYPFGGELVTDRWFQDGDEGVLAMYDDPPRSSAAVLRQLAGTEAGGEPDIPPLSATDLPDGWSVVADDTMGGWIAFAVLRRAGAGEDDASAVARAWLGDHMLVIGGPTDDEMAAAWTLRFSGAETATRFAATMRDGVVPEGVRRVDQSDRDVTMVLAVDDASLEVWQGRFAHAVAEPGPRLRVAPLGHGPERDHPKRLLPTGEPAR